MSISNLSWLTPQLYFDQVFPQENHHQMIRILIWLLLRSIIKLHGVYSISFSNFPLPNQFRRLPFFTLDRGLIIIYVTCIELRFILKSFRKIIKFSNKEWSPIPFNLYLGVELCLLQFGRNMHFRKNIILREGGGLTRSVLWIHHLIFSLNAMQLQLKLCLRYIRVQKIKCLCIDYEIWIMLELLNFCE